MLVQWRIVHIQLVLQNVYSLMLDSIKSDQENKNASLFNPAYSIFQQLRVCGAIQFYCGTSSMPKFVYLYCQISFQAQCQRENSAFLCNNS